MSSLSPRSFLVTETIDLLLYISKTQSFTETSRLMGLSQSMVSRKLSAFEATTGITAVDRSSRPVKLTPEGKMLLEALMPYIEGLPVVLDKLQTDSNIKRKLRIGFVDTFTRYIACHVIKDVSSDVTQCTALSGTSDHLLHCFKRDELDVFITSDPSLGLEDILLRRTVASCLSGIRSVPGKQYRLAASEILRSPLHRADHRKRRRQVI